MHFIIHERLDGLSLDRLVSMRDSYCESLNGFIKERINAENMHKPIFFQHAKISKASADQPIFFAIFSKGRQLFTGIEEIYDRESRPKIHLNVSLDPNKISRANLISIRDDLRDSMNEIIDRQAKKMRVVGLPVPHKVPNVIQRMFHLAPYHNYATTLLDCIVKADYPKIYKIIDEHPEAMFQSIKQTDGSITSPLKYAVKIHDTNTWKHLFENIKHQPALFYQFQQQKKEQKRQGCLDLQPLIDAYANYSKQCQKKRYHKISNWEVENAWVQLGKKQHELLPMHMIKELHIRVYNDDAKLYIDMSSDEISAAFASGMVLMQGDGEFAKMGSNRVAPDFCRVDADAIKQLYEARKTELSQFAPTPTLSSNITPRLNLAARGGKDYL